MERVERLRTLREQIFTMWDEVDRLGTNDFAELKAFVESNVMLETDCPKMLNDRVLPRPAKGYTDLVGVDRETMQVRLDQLEKFYQF